jgi:hypothetical protein
LNGQERLELLASVLDGFNRWSQHR